MSENHSPGMDCTEPALKVAIVHYWFVAPRGGEKVVDALLELYPQADIFTHVIDRERFVDLDRNHRVTESWIGHIPGARRFYQRLLPLMPVALEQFDLRGYDLVISSESGPAKGVLTDPDALHVCYCHSPMRYLWDMYHDYRESTGRLNRLLMPWLTHYLRNWDQHSANRVDVFVANSRYIARRIQKTYRREAVVVHPPVAVNRFRVGDKREAHFVLLGQLVAYKRPDIAIDAFIDMPECPLVVIGEGELHEALKKRAAGASNITFLGHCDSDTARRTLETARGLIFPGIEDFGIVPVEAQAAGTPVVAYAKGGAMDSVIDGVTGLLVEDQSAAAFRRAIRQRFDSFEAGIDRMALRANAERFDETRFRKAIEGVVSAHSA
tara:strand:- start:100 stop:1242 length:1143 start_codon:yes stop_codon:yes gene_type:complete